MAKDQSDAAHMVERIVGVARQVVATDGAQALSVRRVARDAGISLGTVSYYFDSKQALIDACLNPQNQLIYAQIASFRDQLRDGADFDTLVGSAVRMMFSLTRANREVVRLRMLSVLSAKTLPEPVSATFMFGTLDQMGAVIAEHLGVDRAEGRLYVQSITSLVARYALFSPGDLAAVVGEQPADVAARRTEEHIIAVAQAMAAALGPRRSMTAASA